MKNMKKLKILHVIIFTMMFLAWACTSNPLEEPTNALQAETGLEPAEVDSPAPAAEDESQALVFYDDMENKLTFESYPQAIISLAPSTTEILFAVGSDDQIIGRDDLSNYPEEALEITNVGSMFGNLPVEAILALEPDLILVAEIISPEQVAALQGLGLQVYWQQNPLSFEDLYENIRDIATLTGNADDVETVISALDDRVQKVGDTVSGIKAIPTVYYELDGTEPENPWTTGSGTFIDYAIQLAGGENAAAALEGEYAQKSSEELIITDPDTILLADAEYGITPASVAERAGWETITAVQEGNIFAFNSDLLSIPGPRLVEGLEIMAEILHADLFQQN